MWWYSMKVSKKKASISQKQTLTILCLENLLKSVVLNYQVTKAYKQLKRKLESFAKVTEKSRDAVVGFLNGLEEDAVGNGIKMFGAKVAEQNKFTGARKDAIAKGEKKFTVGGEEV